MGAKRFSRQAPGPSTLVPLPPEEGRIPSSKHTGFHPDRKSSRSAMTARLQFPCNCSGHQRVRSSQYRRGELVARRILEHVEATFLVKSQPHDVDEVDEHRAQLTQGRDLHDFRRAILDRECVQVSDEKVSIMESHSGRHDVSLYSRNVRDSLDESTGPDGIEFSMIRFDREQPSIRLDHAVPRAFGFKIARIRIGPRVMLLEFRESGNRRTPLAGSAGRTRDFSTVSLLSRKTPLAFLLPVSTVIFASFAFLRGLRTIGDKKAPQPK
jgi:hypothetical protein